MTPTLVPVDEAVLRDLLAVAVDDTAADEVTPPITAGPAWSTERQQWFLDHHRAGRDRLDGPAAESTWAVMVDHRPSGAVRLKRLPAPATAETGIWLARRARGRGVGTRALAEVSAVAREAGIVTLLADTAEANRAAQAAMRRVGFRLAPATADGRVRGSLDLGTADRLP